MNVATLRLSEERKSWRKEHPPGFIAKPTKNADNSMNLLKWEAGIPGVENTDWEGGVYKLTLDFSNDYPTNPPECTFTPPIYHPNIFTCGAVCLSILGDDWKPSISIPQILLGIQDMLDNPNPDDPAHAEASDEYVDNRARYRKRVRQQALRFVPT